MIRKLPLYKPKFNFWISFFSIVIKISVRSAFKFAVSRLYCNAKSFHLLSNLSILEWVKLNVKCFIYAWKRPQVYIFQKQNIKFLFSIYWSILILFHSSGNGVVHRRVIADFSQTKQMREFKFLKWSEQTGLVVLQ